jgi:hypothetical protein
MKKDEFISLMDSMHEEEKEEHLKKNADYADRNGLNILANFERVAQNLNITPQMALLIYMEKHIDAIRTYIRFGSVMSEPIEGRIKDARVYLSMLRAMVEQKKAIEKEDKVLAFA